MTYVEISYHSNDFQFLTIMENVLKISKLQISLWKEQRIKNQKFEEEKK
jgi:hypothetical protein